ncbi:MAG: hypothetical protein ACQCN3_02635 [Candidatus Bathyarchaeia archaeon]|jgi:hypothetical protein
MTNKGRVYGVTVRSDEFNRQIANFARLEDVSETEAVRMAAELFLVANNKEKAALKKRLAWKQHRNRSHRRLTSFAGFNAPTPILPDLQARNQTKEAVH